MGITHHIVTISPPENNKQWLANCSQHDLSREFHSRLLAYQNAIGHVNEVVERSELSRGYQFDDGDSLTISSSPEIKHLLNAPLGVEGRV